MTAAVPTASGAAAPAPAAPPRRTGGWRPSWPLVATKHLELRKRRGLMIAMVLLTVVPTVLVLGLRLIFHAVAPATNGPAGSPDVFQTLTNLMAEFGFLAAAALGAAAGTTDLSEGMFRHLVITGRSRLALYLARIPAGLAIVLPLVALTFTALCLVTNYAGVPQPTSVNLNGVSVPEHFDQAELNTWLLQHPQQAVTEFPLGPSPTTAEIDSAIGHNSAILYQNYISAEVADANPPMNEMAKIGLWLELEVGIGFMVGLGLGSLTGQRTVTVIVLIGLEIVVTPILAAHVIPYFIDGQRLVVGVAMDQLRPAALAPGTGGGPGGPSRTLFGGRGALGIPPMPTWAMIAVIVGWIVGWSGIGAWRMMTRDA